MKNDIKVGIHNEFEIVVRDARTGKVKVRAKSQNIILNQFWSRFLSANNGSCLSYIHFGSGSATPVVTDTSLTTFIAAKAVASVSQDLSTFYADGVIKKKGSIRLQDTEYVGQTISEVGFGYSTSSGSLMTKSLVKDQNGNPLSITKGASEVIDIFATFYVKVPTTINSGKVYFDISKSPTSFMLGFLCCYGALTTAPDGYYYPGYYAPKVLFPSSAWGYALDSVANTYDVANRKVTITPPNITAANGNIGGIESLRIGNLILEFPCDGFAQPALVKEVIATGDGSKKDFKCAFGRILNNGTAKLYVNDVEVSATFDYEHPGPSSYISQWMQVLSGRPDITTAEMELDNPFFAKFGLDTVYGRYFNLYASNDRTNWSLAASRSLTSSGSAAISSTYKYYRYWKIAPYGSSQGWLVEYITSAECLANLVIHTASAPAGGATVAMTYQPRCLAKDASHVLNNMSIVLTFNEYTP